MDLNNAVMTSNNFADFTGNFTSGNTTTSGSLMVGDLWPYTIPSYNWITYSYPYSAPNKTEKAYQVVRALMKAKVIKLATLGKFFEAMDEVVKAL